MKGLWHHIREYSSSGVLGFLGGLVVLCLLLAIQTFNYAEKLNALEADRKRIDAALVRLESSMKDISTFRDRIDVLTNNTLDKEFTDATTSVERMRAIRSTLSDLYQFNSQESRELNSPERIEDLYVGVQKMAHTMRVVSTILDLRRDIIDGIPSITPSTGWISSNYGERRSPFTGEVVYHRGIDIGAEEGSFVVATADGVVDSVVYSTSYGNRIDIRHPYDVVTRYAHNAKAFVKPGQKVRRGEVIASVGSTGRSTGPHVHYEVLIADRSVDPINYLLDREFSDIANVFDSKEIFDDLSDEIPTTYVSEKPPAVHIAKSTGVNTQLRFYLISCAAILLLLTMMALLMSMSQMSSNPFWENRFAKLNG